MLLGTYLAAFGVSHPLAKQIGAWPSVLAVAAVTGAAAVAAVIVGGLSVAAHSAMPGDPLWGVSKTMFSDRAGNVELVMETREEALGATRACIGCRLVGEANLADKFSEAAGRAGDLSAVQRVSADSVWRARLAVLAREE